MEASSPTTRHAEAATLAAVAATLGLPGGATFRPLGRGTDHQAFATGDLVVRIDIADDAERSIRVEREVGVLRAVASASPLPVPQVAASRPDLGVIVVRRLSGEPALDRPPAAPEVIAAQLAEFVGALAGIDRRDIAAFVEVDDTAPEVYLAELVELRAAVRPVLTGHQQRALDTLLDTAPPPPAGSGRYVFAHHDLGAEHVLLDEAGQTITGVIDWSDAAIADPAHDLGRLLRDFGATVAAACASAFAREDDDLVDRIVFHARCAVVEDLAYGIETGDRRYTDASLAAFDRAFAERPMG